MKYTFLLILLICLIPAISHADGTDAYGNVLYGTGAGASLETDGTGARAVENTVVGYGALGSDSTGSAHTVLGFGAARNLTSGIGTIVIGYLAGDTLTVASHRLVIQNGFYPAYGIFGSLNTGYFGINNASPAAALDVTGSISASGSITGLVRCTAVTTDTVMTLANFPSGSLISVTNTCEITLPTATAGVTYTFFAVGTDSTIIKAGASDNVDVPGDPNETEIVAAGTADEVVTLTAYDATSWKIISYVGTWEALGD